MNSGLNFILDCMFLISELNFDSGLYDCSSVICMTVSIILYDCMFLISFWTEFCMLSKAYMILISELILI
jgi:hypothetical protein